MACVQGSIPEHYLAELRIFAGESLTPYRVKSAVGLEGQADSLQLDPGTWCMALSDMAGNEGCRHCVQIESPTSVPISLGLEPAPRFYDLAGRRVRPPFRSGIYFVRAHNGTRRTILVR